MDRLSLHPLTALRSTPSEFLDIAGRLGCQTVSFFVHAGRSACPHVDSLEQARDLRRQAKALGIRICSLDVFSIGPDGLPDSFAHALDRGAALGGERVTVTIGDPDLARARDSFDDFCAMAGERDLAVHVEFHAFGTLNTLAATRDFLALAPTPATISADVLHFYRNEGGLASLLGDHTGSIGHGQLCDGPLVLPRENWLDEAVTDRRLPGEGEFDLVAFLRALPPTVVIDIEAPTLAHPGASDFDMCDRALSGARAVMARAFDAEPREAGA
ncbi:sugar phosphate isomerase/epimerase family protein [Anianabacter salinae]|uniref:sugar phosphate isomerase/epimerase family protein n=1 Tax=Anianabacter salinae TaxID=2851023 RepID=UPI00225E6A59|nr:sugar phosphate isomerase/epimerase [Anianabacter salinae]MBV0911063.1 sugar phosphate isomerase/epimerase [Anianabacter salinae]